MYGSQTETAIAAMSRLAEVYDNGRTRLSAADIADARGLQRPFVAKILTQLSQAGLVNGNPGPGGGYSLARSPNEIRLHDVFKVFEREDDDRRCPFGGGICGVGPKCALHDQLAAIQSSIDTMLHDTTFDVFTQLHNARESNGTLSSGSELVQLELPPRRQTYRAPHPHRRPASD